MHRPQRHAVLPRRRTAVPARERRLVWRRLGPSNLVPGGVVLDTPNEFIPSDPDRYGPNGDVTLAIDGDALTEVVHAPGGEAPRTTALD